MVKSTKIENTILLDQIMCIHLKKKNTDQNLLIFYFKSGKNIK